MESPEERSRREAKELEERIDRILLKRTAGEKLTHNEELVLAYCYTAPACHHRH